MFAALITIVFIILGIIAFFSTVKAGIFHVFRDRSQDHYELIISDVSDHYEKGHYDLDTNVFVKGPMKYYSNLRGKKFYGFRNGNMLLQNSTGKIEVYLDQLENYSVYPILIQINEKYISLLDYNGQYFNEISESGTMVNPLTGERKDYHNIDIVGTLLFTIEECKKMGFDQNLIEEYYLLFKRMAMHNDLINNGVILGYHGSDKNKYEFVMYAIEYHEKIIEVFEHAGKVFEDYVSNYQTKRSESQDEENFVEDSYLKSLLKIMELSIDTSDFDAIKKQYRRLAKIYHPDLQGGSKERMVEINNAYEELCRVYQRNAG